MKFQLIHLRILKIIENYINSIETNLKRNLVCNEMLTALIINILCGF
jgi:hypothetical protein